MEERKLNLNAPLLSVRRFSMPSKSSNGENGNITGNSQLSRIHTLSSHISALALDQVTEPVAVPFLWEHIPGRAKSRSGPLPKPPEKQSVMPRAPPGRVLDVVTYRLENEFEDRTGPQIEASSSTENVTKLECFKGSSDMVDDDGDDDDDDGDYSDALDTLSPTDSFSLSCSVSGLSGSDGPFVKPSGTFSTNPETRDFMMSRFLPAAKAMALEPPQYSSRKQPVAVEQPRQIIKVVSLDRKPTLDEYRSKVIPRYFLDKEEQASDEEDEEHEDPGNVSAKACGLFPRLCFKNSLCLLNPVPGMKIRTQADTSFSSEVGRSGKAASIRSHSQTVQKHAQDAAYKHKSDLEVPSPKLQGVKNKVTGQSNRFTYSADLQRTGGSSPYRKHGGQISPFRNEAPQSSFRSDRISPYRNEAPQSPFRGVGFLGVPKDVENFRPNRLNSHNNSSNNFQEVLSNKKYIQGTGSVSPAVEKTLYVDTVNVAEISCSNSCSSDTKGGMDPAGEDFVSLLESRGMEEFTAESSFQDIKCLNILKGRGLSEPGYLESVDANLPTFSDISHLSGQIVALGGFNQDEKLDQESMSMKFSKAITVRNPDINNDSISKADDGKNANANANSVQSSLSPPLPKSPSESWLWRTLPSISSKSLFSHSHLGTPRKQDLKMSSTNTKWETIVKASKLNHDHVRYSEEFNTQVSQQ